MLFQALDDKEVCVGVYANDKFYFKKIPKNLTKTWSYSAFLKDKDVEYASLYCEGKSLEEVCPAYLKKDWDKVKDRLTAFYRAAAEVKLDLNMHCVHNVMPPHFLKELCRVKNKITQHVITVHKKPTNYEQLLSVTKVLTEIKNRKLNLDLNLLDDKRHELKTRNFLKRMKNTLPYISYNLFGTKTGRLTTKKNSFPILTMNKNYRAILKPRNDWLVEFDYNAAELRVMLGLLGKNQPQEDLHEWNLKNIYKELETRERAKKRIFAWLYNPESNDTLSSEAYDRESIKKKYWDGKKVATIFNREIESDEHHAVNYIIQSTFADLFLEQVVKVHNFLKGKKSFISFMVHDSLVVDLAEEEREILPELKKILAETSLGKFKISLNAGKNFGALKELKI